MRGMYNEINHRRNRETLGEKKVSSSSARWHKGAKTVIGQLFRVDNFFISFRNKLEFNYT